MTIEVIETATEVVEVIEAGPAGPIGPRGPVGQRVTAVSSSLPDQIVQNHDGTANTEDVVIFNDFANDDFTISGNVFFAIKDLMNTDIILELHTRTSGGGNKIADMSVWIEVSVDGIVWTPSIEDSLRIISIADENSGLHTLNLTVAGVLPAGTYARIVVTNSGDTQSNLILSGGGLLTSHGILAGRAAKIVIIYDAPT